MENDFYPEFKPLELDDLTLFDRVFKDNPPLISEFTFSNLYAWRKIYAFSFSVLNGLLIISSEKENVKKFFTPVGKGDLKSAMEKIASDNKGIFIRVPEEVKKFFDNDRHFVIAPDRANADYLYNVPDLIRLPGKKYDGKRGLIRRFKAEHAYEYMRIDAANASLCLDFEEYWCSLKNCERVEGLSNERRAIREMIKNYSLFRLSGGAIKTEGAVHAICLAQGLNPDTLVVHVLKADPAISGLYQTMLQEFLAREALRSRYVNLEQDLGIAGLRQAKLSYHPCAMIDKYTLSLAQ